MTTVSRDPVAGVTTTDAANARPARGAVLAMTLCVFVLIASEFMPASLLTPIARDLGLTGGQAISISALFAVATTLCVTTAVGALYRRLVLIGMALLLAVSGARSWASPSAGSTRSAPRS